MQWIISQTDWSYSISMVVSILGVSGIIAGTLVRIFGGSKTRTLRDEMHKRFEQYRNELDQHCDRTTERFSKLDLANERRDGRLRVVRENVHTLKEAVQQLKTAVERLAE
jgi:uncharacterized membrane-anchored protein YhcB (DUF1043 family)